MVKSRIQHDKINYNENKVVDDEDIGYESSLYETTLFNNPIQIGGGKPKYTYSAHNVVYYSLYLIINDEIKSRIGVVEYDSNDVINSLDEDGDLILENGNIIFFISKDELIDIINSENNKQKERVNDHDHDDQSDDDCDSDDEYTTLDPIIINDESVLLDNDPDMMVINDENDITSINIPDEKKTNSVKENDKILEHGLFEDIVGIEIPDLLLEETKEISEELKSKFSPSPNHNWVSKFMKNPNYGIIDNEGRGDSLFATIRDAYEQIGKKTTVSKLRTVVSDEVTEKLFSDYQTLYNTFLGQQNEIDMEMKSLKKTGKMLKKRSEQNGGNKDEQKMILDQAREIVDKYNTLSKENKDAKQLVGEFDYMKDNNTIDTFKNYIKQSDFNPDSWSISILERALNMKLIILSEKTFKSGDLDATLQCGKTNESDLERQGNYKPDYYIMVSYSGSQYKLITYKDKHIFKFSEIPYAIKALIINKCMERNSGPFYLIQDIRNFKLKLGLDANEGEPQDNEDEYVQSDLYDNNISFMFHSLSDASPRAGKGSGEYIPDMDVFSYNDLNKIPEWRRKMDDSWSCPFTVDDHRWNSVEHYCLGSQYKKGFPDFYNQFSLDSNSEISKDVSLARLATSKSGKSNENVLREKHITPDPDFFEIGVNPRHKQERITAIIAKFNQNLDLKNMLEKTKRAKLIKFNRGREPELDYDIMKYRKEITNMVKN